MPITRDECILFKDLCQNGRCVNTPYSYQCECYNGYRLDETQAKCVGKVPHSLSHSSNYLEDLSGSFECFFLMDIEPHSMVQNSCVFYFVDIDECQQSGICLNGHCMNQDGSFKCICDHGYVLSSDGLYCTGEYKLPAQWYF